MERNRLIIVGNGLDLSLGLKTSYKDFIFYHYRKELEKTIRNGNRTATTCSDDETMLTITTKDQLDLGHTFEHNLSRFLSALRSFNSIKDLGDVMIMDQYSLRIRNSSEFKERLLDIETWGDVERSYFDSLIDIIDSEKGMEGNRLFRESVLLFEVRKLNQYFDNLRESLINYIKIEDEKIKSISDELNRIEVIFDDILSGKSFQGETKDYILNFNYTSTLKHVLRERSRWVGLINIHGSVLNSDEPIIFGYGDDSDEGYKKLENLNHPEFLRQFKSHKYSQNGKYEELLNYIGLEDFEVRIVGHSCGLSDRTMLKTIFEHRNCKAIHTYHYRAGKDALNDHFEKDINVSRHFDDKIKKRAVFKPYDPNLRY